MIRFTSDSIQMPSLDTVRIQRWIQKLASTHQKKSGNINYIFCSDQRILEVNQQFLQHDYFTDIITFDYSQGMTVSGDLFISLETVASNAEMLGVDYDEELNRVLAHGVLHLCGFKDKTTEDAAIMRQEEQKALSLLSTLN